MKKTLAILLLCLGFSIGASAQKTEADNYAKQITVALNDRTQSRITIDDYVKICESIGTDIGEYITTLELEEIEPFLEHFFHCLYYHFAEYDFPREQADMIIESFKAAFYGALSGEDADRTEESVVDTADHFAKEMASLIEDLLNGDQDQKAGEKVGFDIGSYLARLTPDKLNIFEKEFYEALTVHLARIPALAEFSHEEIKGLADMIKEQYDPIFEPFK